MPPAIEAMFHYTWPGNVRELINHVCRAVAMAEDRLLTPVNSTSTASSTKRQRRLTRYAKWRSAASPKTHR
ncbi:AAA-type ATPase lid domain-containing protein [Paraburkholderia madseniana]